MSVSAASRICVTSLRSAQIASGVVKFDLVRIPAGKITLKDLLRSEPEMNAFGLNPSGIPLPSFPHNSN